MGEAHGLEGHEALVIGSAVYLGSWRKEALAFLDQYAEALNRVPVWLFSSGPTASDPMDRALSDRQRRRLDAVGARDHHLFRGALDPEHLGFLERKAVKAAKQPLGDFRDWTDVKRWADAVADSSVIEPVYRVGASSGTYCPRSAAIRFVRRGAAGRLRHRASKNAPSE
jgi:menaquinone-dependent protoporphyrinogen oxidase